MRTTFLLLLLASSTGAKAQDALCDDLWFTRNLVFDRAGYCFGSPLGQAVFGTQGCTTKSPELSESEKSLVARVKAQETEWQCKVDTNRRRLDMPHLSLRKAMDHPPVNTGYESACIGWRGAPVPLRTAPGGATTIGRIEAGDTINLGFELEGSWEFVYIYRDNALRTMGWAQLPVMETWPCDNFAG